MSVDTADVLNTDLDVSFGSPRWSPGVLDEEVVLSAFGSVSDSEDTVVKLGSASRGGDNTAGVRLEDSLVGLDGDGHWSVGEGSLKVDTGGVRLDISVSTNLTSSLGGVVLALGEERVGSSVWVVSLEHEWGGLDVGESVVHESTIASVVLLRAVNELLLREGLEVSGGKEFSTLNGTSGGESPA